MKKNLRIVSVAAALLAVAPVAATAIATPATTVSAATATTDAKALADAQFVLPTLNLDMALLHKLDLIKLRMQFLS